jgi:hypothetical protein
MSPVGDEISIRTWEKSSKVLIFNFNIAWHINC